MNLPIEILIFLIIICLLIFWSLLMFTTKKYKIWRYKPENDKGKRAEESRRAGRAGREFIGIQRPFLPERRSVFQATSSSDINEDFTSNGKTSSSNGRPSNPFQKRMS